jgi:hypothetical protein
MNGQGHMHCFLQCTSCRCGIPVPPHSQRETRENPERKIAENRQAVFVCPGCGFGNAYSSADVFGHLVPTESLFESGECHLVSLEIECDRLGCKAPKLIHTIQGDAGGNWRPKVAPKHWHFPDTARCGAGHKLRFDESREIRVEMQSELPL